MESYEEADEKLRFDVTDNAFKITLPNRNYYVEVAGVSQATAIVLLREMMDKGLIKKSGTGKLVKYQIVV